MGAASVTPENANFYARALHGYRDYEGLADRAFVASLLLVCKYGDQMFPSLIARVKECFDLSQQEVEVVAGKMKRLDLVEGEGENLQRTWRVRLPQELVAVLPAGVIFDDIPQATTRHKLSRQLLRRLACLPYNRQVNGVFIRTDHLAYAAALLFAVDADGGWFVGLGSHIKSALRISSSTLEGDVRRKMLSLGLLEQNGRRPEWRVTLPSELWHIRDEYVRKIKAIHNAALTDEQKKHLENALVAVVTQCHGDPELLKSLSRLLMSS